VKRLVVGIDPATKVVGFAAFDPDTREILHTQLITSSHKDASRRIKEIAEDVYSLLLGLDPELEVSVYTENTVMRGAGGATFQRGIGAIHAAIPYSFSIGEVQNSTVKKVVGGHGRAEKDVVAAGAGLFFPAGSASRLKVVDLIAAELWDITDALAIGITGFLRDEAGG
jgi:Holliday junction resolvasome RuvABC endonuclease subunit